MRITKDFTAELQQLNERFATDFAIISHIDGNRYTVCQVASDLDIIAIGAEFETEKTYCRAVIELETLIVYEQVGSIDSMLLHPIYTAMQLETYIGYPLKHKGQVIGTLNFSGFESKDPPFSDSDKESVKALAREIEAYISD
jgi:hypothetical protein